MGNTKPLVSVVMPVYNAEQYLEESIKSIQNQTLSDWELVLIDDGSRDKTVSLVEQFQEKDTRIKLYQNEKNSGVSRTLNRGLTYATGRYIARMDADDIAYPERFEKQVEFLERNSEVVLIGCAMQCFGSSNVILRPFTTDAKLGVTLLFHSAVYHPGFMMRAEVVQKHKLHYNEQNQYAEDYEFLVDMREYGRIDNLTEILMDYRVHEQSVSQANKQIQRQSSDKVKQKILQKIGICLTESELSIYSRAANIKADDIFTVREYRRLIKIYRMIVRANRQYCQYDNTILEEELHKHLHDCRRQIYVRQQIVKRIKFIKRK